MTSRRLESIHKLGFNSAPYYKKLFPNLVKDNNYSEISKLLFKYDSLRARCQDLLLDKEPKRHSKIL